MALRQGHGLTIEEAARARDVGVYCLYACGTDEHGWPDAYLQTVAWCLNEEELKREHAMRPLEPKWDALKRGGPFSLLDMLAEGRMSADQARGFLRRIDAGEPYRSMER